MAFTTFCMSGFDLMRSSITLNAASLCRAVIACITTNLPASATNTRFDDSTYWLTVNNKMHYLSIHLRITDNLIEIITERGQHQMNRIVVSRDGKHTTVVMNKLRFWIWKISNKRITNLVKAMWAIKIQNSITLKQQRKKNKKNRNTSLQSCKTPSKVQNLHNNNDSTKRRPVAWSADCIIGMYTTSVLPLLIYTLNATD